MNNELKISLEYKNGKEIVEITGELKDIMFGLGRLMHHFDKELDIDKDKWHALVDASFDEDSVKLFKEMDGKK